MAALEPVNAWGFPEGVVPEGLVAKSVTEVVVGDALRRTRGLDVVTAITVQGDVYHLDTDSGQEWHLPADSVVLVWSKEEG